MKGYIMLFLTMFPILAAQAQYNDFVLGFKAGAVTLTYTLDLRGDGRKR